MARFDIHAFDGGYVVDLQNDFVAIPGSRVVAPLVQERSAPKPTQGLHPQILVEGEPYRLAIHLLAAIPAAGLKTPIASCAAQGDEITRALDILFQGY